MYDQIDDYELVQLIAEGNKEAFTYLFDREMLSVYRLCISILTDKAMAEDVTQEAFATLWTSADSWRPEAKIKTWLLHIARNRCIDILRKHKKHDEKNPDYAYYSQSISTELVPSEEQLIRTEQVKKIENAIFLLPERQREAISLVYKCECSGVEAAEIMNMSVSAMESLLARARRKLKEIINDETQQEEGRNE